MKTKLYRLIPFVCLTLLFHFVQAQGILITPGTYLVSNGSANIVINNAGFTNNGTFTPSTGSVVLKGSAATVNSFVAGSTVTGFYNLELNKSANGAQLNSNVSVVNSLLFTSGDSLFLNNHNIDLGSTGNLSGETNNKRITGKTGGYIQSTVVLNAPSNINPGNLGLSITSAANLGSTQIRRGHVQQGNASVYRYFDITPTTNTALNAIIKFNYLDNETAGIGEGNLGLFFSKNLGGQWRGLGENGIDMALNILTKNNIDTLSRFTLANISDPLAVNFLYLKAKLVNGQTQIDWATTSESGNDHFDIERSADGLHFNSLSSVRGSGNTNTIQFYSGLDPSPFAGMNYYRLKQVDITNLYRYSYIVAVNTLNAAKNSLNVFPNPATSVINISVMSEKQTDFTLQIANAQGMIMQRRTVHGITGLNLITCDVHTWPSGIYYMSIDELHIKGVQLLKP